MGLAGRTSALLGIFALLVVTAFAGCENPFSPLDKSSKIEGLSYIDFTLTWDRWDSDPEFDGSVVTIDYYNSFGDALSFHDKDHDVVIEFWSQRRVSSDPTNTDVTYDQRFFAGRIRHSNSDSPIRIPIEAYEAELRSASEFDETLDYKAFVVVRVYPPDSYPRAELAASYTDITIYQPEPAETPPLL